MKIALAQINVILGDLEHNLKVHLHAIDHASKLGADLVLFPELSLTGYFPEKMKSLAMDINDDLLLPFQASSDKYKMHIAIGIPSLNDVNPKISICKFMPDQKPSLYSKQILHDDEFKYFEAGSESQFWSIRDNLIYPAICYESMQLSHNQDAISNHADVYAISVAKSSNGMIRSHKHYSDLSNRSEMTILVSNFVGNHGHFIAGGRSAVWSGAKECIASLDEARQGLLVWDTELKQSPDCYYD